LILIFIYFLLHTQLKIFSIAINLYVPKGAWRSLELTTPQPLKATYDIVSESGRAITLVVYTPQSTRATYPAMVLYTPFLEKLDDQRIINILDTFARVGFITVLSMRHEDHLVANVKDVKDIVSTVQFVKQRLPVSNHKIGLIGLSYGNGPTIVAAADPRIKADINFIASFSGFYDLANVMDFLRTGQYSYQDIRGSIVPSAYTQEVLRRTLEYYQITNMEEFMESEQYQTLRQGLSPSTVLSQLDTFFFIIHSTDDNFIPYTESLRLRDALSDRVPHLFILNTFYSHEEYKKPTWSNIIRLYLPSISNMYRGISTLLSFS